MSRSGLYYGPVIELYDGQPMHLTDELYTSYEGLKSKPEWGLNISKKNMPIIEPHRLETTPPQLRVILH